MHNIRLIVSKTFISTIFKAIACPILDIRWDIYMSTMILTVKLGKGLTPDSQLSHSGLAFNLMFFNKSLENVSMLGTSSVRAIWMYVNIIKASPLLSM